MEDGGSCMGTSPGELSKLWIESQGADAFKVAGFEALGSEQSSLGESESASNPRHRSGEGPATMQQITSSGRKK